MISTGPKTCKSYKSSASIASSSRSLTILRLLICFPTTSTDPEARKKSIGVCKNGIGFNKVRWWTDVTGWHPPWRCTSSIRRHGLLYHILSSVLMLFIHQLDLYFIVWCLLVAVQVSSREHSVVLWGNSMPYGVAPSWRNVSDNDLTVYLGAVAPRH